MPTPSTTPELFDRIRKSGLVSPAELSTFLKGLGASAHELNPAQILDRLIDAHLLTKFHADRLAAGKYKGFVLGSYTILDRLGAGGMGQVFLAEHAAMRRFVALKVLPGNVYEDDIARERFFREARAAATLDHPNIVRVFDMNREGKLLYLVMEYVEGVSLQTLVEKDGRTSLAAAASYAYQVAHGVAARPRARPRAPRHQTGKPPRGSRRGGPLARPRPRAVGIGRGLEAHVPTRRRPRTILGTVDYLAPEQALDSSNVDIRADIYSLGATLYFLLAGHPVFPEGRAGQKLMWQQWRDPAPIDRLRAEVPPALAAVVHKALSKKREDRFQTPLEMAEALTSWIAGPVPPPGGLIVAPPYRNFLGRTPAATGANRPSKAALSETTPRSWVEATPNAATRKVFQPAASGVVRLDSAPTADPTTQATPEGHGPKAKRRPSKTATNPRPSQSHPPSFRPCRSPRATGRWFWWPWVRRLHTSLVFFAIAALLFASGWIKI